MPKISIQVQTQNFDLSLEYQKIYKNNDKIGAIVPFIGMTRGSSESNKDLDYLYLEHYPNMTEKVLNQLAQTATVRWDLKAITIIHRIGKIKPNEQIVLVMTASSHRQSAFEATQFLIDCLKTMAPFWKKEVFKDGSSEWLEPKQNDLSATKYWLTDEEYQN